MSDAADDGGFFPRVYDELKVLAAARLAHEAPGHTLDATALVHEAYLRLADASFADRSRFFAPPPWRCSASWSTTLAAAEPRNEVQAAEL